MIYIFLEKMAKWLGQHCKPRHTTYRNTGIPPKYRNTHKKYRNTCERHLLNKLILALIKKRIYSEDDLKKAQRPKKLMQTAKTFNRCQFHMHFWQEKAL